MITYRVDGMTCDGCATSVSRAIKSAAPTAVIEVDLDNKSVAVTGLDNDDTIKTAIEDAGFDFGGRL